MDSLACAGSSLKKGEQSLPAAFSSSTATQLITMIMPDGSTPAQLSRDVKTVFKGRRINIKRSGRLQSDLHNRNSTPRRTNP